MRIKNERIKRMFILPLFLEETLFDHYSKIWKNKKKCINTQMSGCRYITSFWEKNKLKSWFLWRSCFVNLKAACRMTLTVKCELELTEVKFLKNPQLLVWWFVNKYRGGNPPHIPCSVLSQQPLAIKHIRTYTLTAVSYIENAYTHRQWHSNIMLIF